MIIIILYNLNFYARITLYCFASTSLFVFAMVLSVYAKQRIVHLVYVEGRDNRVEVARLLHKEGIVTTRKSVAAFLRRYEIDGTIERRQGSGRPTKLSMEVLRIVEIQMRTDDETTAVQLHKLLASLGHEVSLTTILNSRRLLGWTFRGSAYCQLIRQPNKVKRLAWATENMECEFEDVIWTDEASIQMESHRRFCHRKRGEQPTPKPRPKHPFKVHVWAGISCRGATNICIFTGTLEADGFCQILNDFLIPFVRDVYPDHHRLMMDNDPKHTSIKAKAFLQAKSINWWKTPAESPDFNPIENLWHEVKEYLRRDIKPTTKDELIGGIQEFWKTVDVPKCIKYIRHLKKVIPKAIEANGEPTGY